jgi:hypothetical protein
LVARTPTIIPTATPAKETEEFKAKRNLSLSTLSNKELFF